MPKYYIGVDVGGTKLAYGLFNEKSELLDRFTAATNPESEPDEMMDEMCSHIYSLLSKNSIDRSLLGGVGAAFPSHIDFDKGIVITTSNLPKWNNIPAKSSLSEKLGVKVEVDNDANVAAIAEHRFGAGKSRKNMLFLTISTGIGGGIIINNEIFRGSYGAAGEFGHMIISDDGYLCGCGNKGCVQSLASGPMIARYTREKIQGGCSSKISDMVKDLNELTCKHIEDAAKTGDKLAVEVIERTGDILGVMFANLYQIFNIDYFVVGGGVSKFGKPLFDRFNDKFKKLSKISSSHPVSIEPAVLGDNAGIIGAVTLVT